MAHIDRGYKNPLRSLRNKRPQKHRKDLDTWTRGYQLLGAFQPVLDMGRDITNTFRAYKGWRQVVWDIAQPIRGLLNGVAGVAQIVYSPVYLLGQLTLGNIIDAIRAPKGKKLSTVGGNTTVALAKATSWFVNGALKIVRGATQVAFTPLSWLKMIVRGFSTAENKGVQRLVDDKNIQRLVKQGEELARQVEQENQQKAAATPVDTSTVTESIESSSQPLVEKSNNEKKLDAINRQLKLKFKKEVKRSTRKTLGAGMADERENNGAVQDNANIPKRLHFIGTQKPIAVDGSRNYVKFFKDASVERKAELDAISVKRFGRFSRAARAA